MNITSGFFYFDSMHDDSFADVLVVSLITHGDSSLVAGGYLTKTADPEINFMCK